MEMRNAAVVIAGASGGFGSALAGAFADEGARLVVSGRDDDRLAAVAEASGAHAHAADLREPQAPEKLIAAAAAHLGALDVVVCSVGVVAFGPTVDLDDAVLLDLFAINALVPMRLTRAALGALQKGGTIINISGIVAEQPTAGMAAYSASKAALSAFDVAARREARRMGIRILDVRPPHMETGLSDRPLAGQPPKLPTGRDPNEVARLIVAAVACDANEVALT
jgi:cyclic-di-GMP-binding biofilm dispersal mediator protein